MPKVGMKVRLYLPGRVNKEGRVNAVTDEFIEVDGTQYDRSKLIAWVQL